MRLTRTCSASKLEIAQYRDEVATIVDELHKRTVELLEGDWLKLENLDSTIDAAGESRLLIALRTQCHACNSVQTNPN